MEVQHDNRLEKGRSSSLDEPWVSVIIINWNSWRDTIRCLDSVVAHDYSRLSIIVIDNGSEDDSICRLEEWKQRQNLVYSNLSSRETLQRSSGSGGAAKFRTFVLLSNEENMGFSSGNNIGLNYALHQDQRPEYILFLNNDCVLHMGCVTHLITAADNNYGIAAAAQYVGNNIVHTIHVSRWPKINYLVSPLFNNQKKYKIYWLEVDVDWVSGAVLLLGVELCRDIISRYGYMWREDYFLYCEDFELSVRLKNMGIGVVVSMQARVDHRMGGSAGGLLSIYYMRRNRIHLCRDCCNYLFKIPCLVLVAGIGFARAVRQWLIGNKSIALVHLVATKDGLLDMRGKWILHDQYAQKSRSA